MSNFLTRAITGAAFVLVMVFCIGFSYITMAALFTLIICLGLWEFYSLLQKANLHPQKHIGVVFGTVFSFSLMFLIADGIAALSYYTAHIWLIIPAFFMLFFFELFRKKEQPFLNVAFTVLGLIYVTVPFVFLAVTSLSVNVQLNVLDEAYCTNLLLGYFFLVWSNDTFAYLVGRGIGKTKLFERISPKKTWEGTIGGILLTQVTAYIIAIYFTELTTMQWLVTAAIVSVTGTLGDLVESMFKRSLGVKDSGGILPGHGGILDRFDGVLLSAPFVCAYWLLAKN
jgi:phosphatidate cytidylyltransferase